MKDDLFSWGSARAARTEQTERTEPTGRTDLRLEAMKSALTEMRVIPAARFTAMFGWSDRDCRAIAAASDGHILGTNAGYVLTERATPEEFSAANGRIYSQAKNMLRRAIRERKVRHQQVGGKL
jgi:hypothetical protein